MEQPAPSPTSYLWVYLKAFGRECWLTWRLELFASIATSVVTFAITRYKDTHAAETLWTCLESSAIVLGLFAVWHAGKVSWILYRDKASGKEHEHHHAKFALAGAFVLLWVAAGLAALENQMFKAGEASANKNLCKVDSERLKPFIQEWNHVPVVAYYSSGGGEESEQCAVQITYVLGKMGWASMWPQKRDETPEGISIQATEKLTGMANDLRGAFSRAGVEMTLAPNVSSAGGDYIQIFVGPKPKQHPVP
jgi:hypothetical protein